MIIGHFHYDSDADTYTGEIRTLTFQRARIALRPLQKTNDREPDYRVVEVTELGAVEFGAAWQRRSDRGQDYLSVQLDDPSFGRAVSAALFPDEDDRTASLVWSRPQREPAPQANRPERRPEPGTRRPRASGNGPAPR